MAIRIIILILFPFWMSAQTTFVGQLRILQTDGSYANIAAEDLTRYNAGKAMYFNENTETINYNGYTIENIGSLSFGSSVTTNVAANQDNFTPTNWATNTVHHLNVTAGSTITGFSALPGGTMRMITNVGNSAATLPINTTSDEENQIGLSPGFAPLTLSAGKSIWIRYDEDYQPFGGTVPGRWVVYD